MTKIMNMVYSIVFMITIMTFTFSIVYAQGTINLHKTSQNKCCDQYGTEINCTEAGQDGEIRAGVSLSSQGKTTGTGAETNKTTNLRLIESYGKLPLHFEANQGQAERTVRYISRGSGYGLFLTPSEAVLNLRRASETSGKKGREALNPVINSKRPLNPAGEQSSIISNGVNPQTGILRMKWEGANQNPTIEGVDKLEGKSHYFIGNDPDQWRNNILLYRKVRYQDLYPGIDLIYYGNQRQLEYDLIIKSEGDPSAILLLIEGAEVVKVDEGGNLILQKDGREVIQHAPQIFQEVGGEKQFIKGGYAVIEPSGKNKDKGKIFIGFKIEKYDTQKPLIIDPVLTYSTYLGGSDWDEAHSIAVDSSGSAYITGMTESTDFPIINPIHVTNAGSYDVFVTKFNPAGSAIIYSTYLGGSKADYGYGIAVDSSGNAYITGFTESTNFPNLNPIQGSYEGSGDVFVTKLNPAGSALVYSTYLGGSSSDWGFGIAVDNSRSAYITGGTLSNNFPTLNPIQGTYAGGGDVFVTKLNPAGSALVYSTYLGGSKADSGSGIAVDSSGSAYITGMTESTDFPIVNPVQITNAGSYDVFIIKLNPAGSALVYSTYLGGSKADYGYGIAVDSSGNAYIIGFTDSTNFPTSNPIQGTNMGWADVFITKLSPTGSAFVYSTYFGGNNYDIGYGIAVGSPGSVYIIGITQSTNFPTLNPIQGAYGSSDTNAFVAGLDITETISTPTKPEGPINGITGALYTYQTGDSSSNLGHSVEYQFDWKGDCSDLSPWDSSTQSKVWNIPGTYNVRSRARCIIDTNFISSWSETLSVTIIAAETVSTPTTLNGPTAGIPKILYSYTTGGSASSFGHSVQYFFDWGDGTNSGWLPVGTTSSSKFWTSTGNFLVKTQARCSMDTSVVSNWSGTVNVTINQAPLPDLTGSWSSMTQTCRNTLQGTKCSLKGKFTLQNIGNLDASTSTIKFYLSDNNTYNGGDTLLKKVETGTITAGGSITGNIKFNLPTGQSASGKYVIAVIDADNTVVESNEANNQIVYGPLVP